MSVQCYSCANYKGGVCSITGGNPFTENPCRCYSPRYEIITHKQNNEPSYAELQDENEELKRELKQMEVQDQVVIDGLRKENAKLKCLALHAMSELYWVQYTNCYTDIRLFRIHEKFHEAHSKAKKALREGKVV